MDICDAINLFQKNIFDFEILNFKFVIISINVSNVLINDIVFFFRIFSLVIGLSNIVGNYYLSF